MNIKDIAKLCGVSPSTVSKILHNKDEDISLETRKRVLAVTKEYQYVPYSKVLKNASSKSCLIGMMMNSCLPELEDMIYSIEEAAADKGYSLIFCNTANQIEKAKKHQFILENKNIDGMIYIGQSKETVENCHIPAVAVWDRKEKTGNSNVADFYYEKKDMEYLAVTYLLEQHHRNIGYVLCGSREADARGYRNALKDYGLTPNEQYIFYGNTPEELSRVGISQCLNMDVTAVLCGDENIANRVYGKLRERGDSVPEGVSVIAIGGSKVSKLLSPPLTVSGIDVETLGKEIVHTLIDMIEERKKGYKSGGRVNAGLMKRNSVLSLNYSRNMAKLVVVGSMNMDCSISVPYLPTDGETLISSSIFTLPGGKGANQAVGAGKLGGLVYMIGCLGNDADGKQIYDSLTGNGVRMDGVSFEHSMQTGKAYINVASDGESTIVVYPGANEKLDRSRIKKYKQVLEGARYCLLSLELSQDTAEYTIKECEKLGVGVIVKPSAVNRLKEDLFKKIEYFVPNEKELKQFVPGDLSIEEKGKILLEKGVKNVIITLGKNGCYFCNAKFSGFFPAADFPPVDTTGAADAFISALAVYLSEGYPVIQAIGFATYAACISITRFGVQSAMVDRAGLEAYRDEILSNFHEQ